jgi:hypothetical protein
LNPDPCDGRRKSTKELLKTAWMRKPAADPRTVSFPDIN